MDSIRTAGYKIMDLSTKESDLEDIFLLMTGTGAKDNSKFQ